MIRPLSSLARRICRVILKDSVAKPARPVSYPELDEVFQPTRDYPSASQIDECAQGLRYSALGYQYLLCFDYSIYEDYVAIYSVKDGEFVGKSFDGENIELDK